MPGYHNDQYFNLGNAGEDLSFGSQAGAQPTRAGYAVKGADNPPFVYPDRTVRTDDMNGAGTTTKFLKRGYVRSLLTFAQGQSLGIRKCQFQFNPETLLQSVQSNDSMLNPLQQDPAQFAQPMPGNTLFSFKLMFDRSMEVNNPMSIVAGATPNIVNPWEQEEPSQVGVLRDVAALYGVIGQGLSGSAIAQIKNNLSDQINREAKTSQLNGDTTVDPGKALGNIDQFLQRNSGNTAFLLPLPVRFVFSTLYMVEGLVTNTSVLYTKFSTNMVPMRCEIEVTLEAKYIGFAQKDTFTTWALEQRAAEERFQLQQSADNQNALYNAFNAVCGTMEVVLLDVAGAPSSIDTLLANAVSNQTNNVRGVFPFSEIKNAQGGPNPVRAIFEDGTVPLSIETQSYITIWGPFDDLSSFRGTRAQQASQSDIESFLSGKEAFYRGSASGKGTVTNGLATTTSEWDKMAKGWLGPENKAISNPPAFGTSKWFIVGYNGQVFVTAGDNSFVGRGNKFVVVGPGGTTPVDVNVNITWPVVSPVLDQTTTSTNLNVPPDNGPASSQPSSTSSVGKPKPNPRVT